MCLPAYCSALWLRHTCRAYPRADNQKKDGVTKVVQTTSEGKGNYQIITCDVVKNVQSPYRTRYGLDDASVRLRQRAFDAAIATGGFDAGAISDAAPA